MNRDAGNWIDEIDERNATMSTTDSAVSVCGIIIVIVVSRKYIDANEPLAYTPQLPVKLVRVVCAFDNLLPSFFKVNW